jgi:hypothetical protein
MAFFFAEAEGCFPGVAAGAYPRLFYEGFPVRGPL